ncbi:hypothetical protein [Dokdonella sp.]|uniref:hypothetical protein n=1 Tax=Dokdonella sp. TaxID=2291710 RepID=UPI003C5CA97F
MTHCLRTVSRLVLMMFLGTPCMLQAAQTDFEVIELVLPGSGVGSQPDLVSAPDGSLALSWVEKLDTGHRLQFSQLQSPAGKKKSAISEPDWTSVQTIASGDDWFVNWADTPHLVVFRDGTLWAHWLRKNGSGVYDYGVALVRSTDQGRTWSEPIRLEPRGARLDYGFVSLWEDSDHSLGIAWLDSRQKQAPAEGGHQHHDHAGGAMMLRAAKFDAEGARTEEWALDSATCDCCVTSVAVTDVGAVLAYRGRTAEEIRDIRLVRFNGTSWSSPVTVHADNWNFAGCPVNGPSVAASEKNVWVGWYTEADGQPSIRLARSTGVGDAFEAPQKVAEGAGLLGRVNLALDADSLWMTWLIEATRDNAQQLMLARFDARSGKRIQQGAVAKLTARGHASGLPQIQTHGGEAWLVWTDTIEGHSQLRGARVRPQP